MNIKDLIQELQKIPDQDAEVIVDHLVFSTETGNLVLNTSIVSNVLVFSDHENKTFVFLETESFEEEVQISAQIRVIFYCAIANNI